MDIKGWKLNPHIWGVPIDCEESIILLFLQNKQRRK